MARIGVLGFLHESNTFLGVPTTVENFERMSYTRGQAMAARWTGSHHELGGFLEGCAETGLEAVPLMAAIAVPSGAITPEAYEEIVCEMLRAVRDQGPFDGLLIGLHGATVSASHPDADGEFLRRLRALTGPELPVIVTLDLHANVSFAMAEYSTALIAYRSNPHLDQRERGREAALLMGRVMTEGVRPRQAMEAPPLVIAISCQYTQEAPSRGLYEDVETVSAWPGILSASVTMGFYYADVEEMGAAFIAVADNDEDLARRAAQWMARRAWERRKEFIGGLPSPGQAVSRALASPNKPVVLMDVGDNVGAGSPADSTILLAELMRQKARNAMVILCDPKNVTECIRSGVLGKVSLHVGAWTDDRHGAPVAIEGVVRTLSDGRFVETQVRHGGWGFCDQGLTAVVETAEQHTIILTTHRAPPMSLEQVISLGVHPERKDILVVKGVVAPRAAYAPVAGDIILVDTVGVTSDNPLNFAYQRRRRPLFPFESDAAY